MIDRDWCTDKGTYASENTDTSSNLTIEKLEEARALIATTAPIKPKLVFTSYPLPNPLDTGPLTFYKIPRVQRQLRFPRSKKKRIRKKWCKNPKNYGYCDVIITAAPQVFSF